MIETDDRFSRWFIYDLVNLLKRQATVGLGPWTDRAGDQSNIFLILLTIIDTLAGSEQSR